MTRTIEPHIIQKQSIEINFEEMDAAVDVQHRIAELFYERVQPAMNVLFDDIIGNDWITTFEMLEIDCGVLSEKHWQEEWVEQVLRKLKEELRQINKYHLDIGKKAREQFFFFLKNGFFSWNRFYSSINEMEDAIVINAPFLARLKEILRINSFSKKRLMWQFSETFRLRLIQRIIEESQSYSEPQDGSDGLHAASGHQMDINKLLDDFIAGGRPIDDDRQEKDIIEEKRPGDGKKPIDVSKEIYINNAGLVLLHPFLPALFNQLGLIYENKWLNEEAKLKALLVSQFLVSGEYVFPEYDLPLNKILHDFLLSEAVIKEMAIDNSTQIGCEELLREVIRQWGRLKNTGIHSLRETFLQRAGKLTRLDNGWLLQVELKAVDVLLGSLPWGISIVKLPWMNEILYVEWI